ncbi:MAG TPA: N-acyl homoserine lactonase family protein [Baekduia sp.]|nr:N-acyl homoserine lactonase family protein [Baekduia sp.]
MRIHVLTTGRLRANATFLRADGWATGLLGRRRDVGFPVQSFVVEHPEGTFAIDAGLGEPPPIPRWQRRCVPVVADGPHPLYAQLQAAGIAPHAVSRVVLTHLDWDHVGGIEAFPSAEVLVHRPELAAATSRTWRGRYRPDRWPAGFAPTPYDLDGEPLGPFPCSRRLTEAGDVHLVGLPGHSAGHVGVHLRTDDATLLFCGDRVLRADWFAEDLAAGRLMGLGIWHPRAARETSRRLRDLLRQEPAVLLPSHDEDVPSRLVALRPWRAVGALREDRA